MIYLENHDSLNTYINNKEEDTMSYDVSKLAKLGQLKMLAERTKEQDDALASRIKAIEDINPGENTIETIKVNGVEQSIVDKAVDITVPTKASDLTNDTNFQTAEEVEAAINSKVASTYKAAGSISFESLPELVEANLGKVYNVTDNFTTTDNFVEWSGIKHSAGTNVAIVKVGDYYKYDCMSGFVDLTGYVEKVSSATVGNFASLDASGNLTDSGKSASDFVAAESGKSLVADTEIARLASMSEGANKAEKSDRNGYIKIDGTDTLVYEEPSDVIHGSVATDEEVTEMLSEVFNPA